MFEQLQELIKQHSGQAIVNNPDVPNADNEAVEQEAGSSLVNSLKNMLSGGGAGDVMNLFNRKDESEISNHPVTQNVSSDFVSNLMNKFGLNSEKASGIASALIPMVMSKLVNKTNDSNDKSFDIQGIFNSLSGNKTGGMDISGMLSKFGGSGMDKNGDGKVDLSDLKAAFGG